MCSHRTVPETEIGGYFGLSLPDYGDPFPDTFKFQSARAALRAALECAGISRVFLPVYICDAVIQAVADSGAVVEPYLLDDLLYPENLPGQIPEDCALLYVNYFGLCRKNVARLLKNIPNNQLIIDNSQALFAQPGNAAATIYSVRKFIGTPDGGLLTATGANIIPPEKEDTGSLKRMNALLLRMAYSARAGYSSYVASEETLNDTKPLKMSRLTKRLIASIDMNTVKQRRRENFLELAEQLDNFNEHKWPIEPDTVPLCYPLLVDTNIDPLRKQLIDSGIFIPAYWPETKSRAAPNSMEYRLSHCCLFIPCDQRYSTSQMKAMARKITAILKNIK